ncbi:hypothetical protein [Chitinophaga sp.]|uniref:hypothetical protein n=1 Tax=Chitinophaga sp. TaxID=1869181 RepID=UPI0025C456C4|nr:hypothetical protein [Chitinophaga sp.]
MTNNSIKERLIQLACRTWKISDHEKDALLDPVVKLLLEGLADELERIHSESHAHQTAMVHQLASILIPTINTCAHPADVLLHALPKEEIIITPEQEFMTHLSNHALVKPSFIPTGHFKLTPGHVTHIVCPQVVLQMNDIQPTILIKDIIWHNTPSQVYVRLAYPSGAMPDLYGLSLCFLVNNTAMEDILFHVLPLARIYANEEPIKTTIGFHEASNTPKPDAIWSFWQQKYKKHYLTINSHYTFQEADMNIPAPLRYYQQQNGLKTFLPGIWLKIELPGLPMEALPDIVCQCNCFPVVNLRAISTSLAVTHDFQVFPLTGKHSFFKLHSCTDQHQRAYRQEATKTVSDLQPGEYTCDYPAHKRWQDEDLQQKISLLLYRLREEHRLLQPTRNSLLIQHLQNLQQLTHEIEQSIDQEEKSTWPILSIKPLPDADFLYIKYFSTDGDLANNIPPGAAFQTTENDLFMKGSIKSLLPSAGGKQPLSSTDITHHFRQQFYSGDKIVTPADIRLCCLAIMGEHLQDCHIKIGSILSANIQEGFRRVLQITLVLSHTGSPYPQPLLTHYKECILRQLEERSFQLLPVCISFIHDM